MNHTCDKCPLAPLNNFTMVAPRGNINGKLFFVGEAPGYTERKIGFTFVGKAGQLLQTYITEYGLDTVAYLTNAIKCRPPKNRTPLPMELAACRSHLMNEIVDGTPRIIVLLGNTAINQFFGKEINNVGKLHGKVMLLGKTFILFGYHPSYMLREGVDPKMYDRLFYLIRWLYRHVVNQYI
jgi:uracil-DNA glycosylase family 4